MLKDKTILIHDYFSKIKSANKESTKREAFKDLLNRLYAGNTETAKIIDAITLGAETNIANIPRKDKLHRGSADTLYNNIIIEYENDLKVSLKHAKEQLAGYLLGQFKTTKEYNYTLIVSDFINWKVVAPKIDQLDQLERLQEHELILDEIPSASFTLTNNNADDFYFWIDRFLFKEEKQQATLKRIKEAFGYQSNVFIESFRELSAWFNEAKKYGEVQVSLEQWKKFLSIAYGKFDATESNFLIHTYLSVFSKMLAYSVISNDDYIDEEELKGILQGDIFNKFNIRNFVDNDFFHWVKSDLNFRNLKKSFRLIAQEISTFDFTIVEEDILKGVYQELIDLDTRRALGEYYTPDWLCERVVQEFDFKLMDKVLDPSCGSGSFLRAAVHRMKQLNPAISIEALSEQIYGIDIHPLSVQIAKTTMLLALGKEIRNLRRPIHINVILSNTLLSPEGVKDLFGGSFKMDIDKESFRLNSQVLEDMQLFDEGVDICEDLAEQTLHKKKISIVTLENSLKQQYKKGGINQQIIESFYKIYEGLKSVKEKGRDSIWKFILQNLYKPYFLDNKFDYIVGNPPWFTYKDVKNEDYQKTLDELGIKYNIITNEQGTSAHLEIAAIFLAHCTNYFLKSTGKLGFVLPRSFFDGKQHAHTREGKIKGLKITTLWDLINVKPLFNINSCVIFTEKNNAVKAIPKEGLKGIAFKGNLPNKNSNYISIKNYLTETEVDWFYIRQGTSSAFSNNNHKSVNKTNSYKKLFQAGATLRPRVFSFVDLDQDKPTDFNDRVLNVKTSASIQPEAKKPWKDIELTGRIESNFLFLTALSKSILPFTLYNPNLIILPILIHNQDGTKKIILQSSKELQNQGFLNTSRWFQNCENIWNIHRTELNKKYTVEEYLNFQNKITVQNLNCRYMVLYNASAKDANATVIDRADLELEFINDHVAYSYFTNSKTEAHYLCSIFNSTVPNAMMKDFQAKGLFGARHVHKKILDVYFPKFNEKSKAHKQLALLSELAHKKIKIYLQDNPPKQELSAIFLGRLRTDIKKHLRDEIEGIDELVKEIIG
jgi:methylase of polypeptide subunit release factors